MSEPDHLLEARRWLRYAREDLEAAEHVPDDPSMAPRHGCLLAQQAAEKALKAVLIFLQLDYPYRHDLDALRNSIPVGWEIKTGYPYLSDLSGWVVEARYPGDWPDATVADARLAAEQARSVYECVQRDLARHGLPLRPQP
jgi:HEPN domain-containing protein